jgi:putative DNA methylase
VTLPKEHGGGEATVIAWLWARTVKCPNPACGAQMPLVRSFWLSTKKGKEAWVEPEIQRNEEKTVHFHVRRGTGKAPEGTVNRRGARCIVCGSPVGFEFIRSESRSKRMGSQLMAIVAEGFRGRLYLEPNEKHIQVAQSAQPTYKPTGEIADNPGHTNVYRYGLTTFGDLFTNRQLVALATFSDLVGEARQRIVRDAPAAGLLDDGRGLDTGGTGAQAYADAVATYLAFAVDKLSDRNSTICSWDISRDNVRNTFARRGRMGHAIGFNQQDA